MTTTSPTQSPSQATQDVSYQCRLLRHAWQIFSPSSDEFSRIGVWRNSLHLRCLRCEMRRHDAFNTQGELETRRYDPPDGYYLKKDEEKPTVEELRVWALRRQRREAGQRARMGG